ncbi:MAG TPA: diguanylate phosphodiesterase [Planctomycetaceae bacterium]|nr:diguanylate phosphodiesterase [Blastopirellula sp.]HAY78651.1 diguanylate phosphodiesterase [Planctomycetaceae bacterium]
MKSTDRNLITTEHLRPNAHGWYLQGATEPDGRVTAHRVHPFPFTIGRLSTNRLQLVWPSVSGRHAELIDTRNGLVLRDVGSTNGTFVNGERVTDKRLLRESDVVQFANADFRVGRFRHEDIETPVTELFDQAVSNLLQFDQLINGTALVPYFQPIVHLHDASLFGYEVLARSHISGFPNTAAMFDAAERLDLSDLLSETCRTVGMQQISGKSPGAKLFLNTHPSELNSTTLISTLANLREQDPSRELILEIHEAAVCDLVSMAALRDQLNDLDIKLAYDDFGQGEARIVYLAEVPPDFLKFDISLITNIDKASDKRQQMLGALVQMVKDLGITTLAEGIETPAEATVCETLGIELGQGYFFGRPQPNLRPCRPTATETPIDSWPSELRSETASQ